MGWITRESSAGQISAPLPQAQFANCSAAALHLSEAAEAFQQRRSLSRSYRGEIHAKWSVVAVGDQPAGSRWHRGLVDLSRGRARTIKHVPLVPTYTGSLRN